MPWYRAGSDTLRGGPAGAEAAQVVQRQPRCGAETAQVVQRQLRCGAEATKVVKRQPRYSVKVGAVDTRLKVKLLQIPVVSLSRVRRYCNPRCSSTFFVQ